LLIRFPNQVKGVRLRLGKSYRLGIKEITKLNAKNWILTGALSAAAAVALGAIGAHGLEAWLEKTFEPTVAADRMANWQTAASYHRFHAIGMIVVGLLLQRSASKSINAGGWLMLLGTMLFSGMLYVYSIAPAKWMGPIFPIGGFSFIAAWLLLAIGVFKQPATTESHE